VVCQISPLYVIRPNNLPRYPLPEVPKGWKPNPQRVWGKNQDKENVEAASAPTPSIKSHQDWKKGVSADEVGLFLYSVPSISDPSPIARRRAGRDPPSGRPSFSV
jgi:G patch domain-containing protein 1